MPMHGFFAVHRGRSGRYVDFGNSNRDYRKVVYPSFELCRQQRKYAVKMVLQSRIIGVWCEKGANNRGEEGIIPRFDGKIREPHRTRLRHLRGSGVYR